MSLFEGKQPMIIFLEAIIGAITVVWIINFGADLIIRSYDGSQINNIFMIIIGPSAMVTALANKISPGGTHD